MDPRIDSSKWKPRQTRGTPSYRYRSYFALGVLAVGLATGLFAVLNPRFSKYYEIIEPKLRNTEEDYDQRALLGFVAQKTEKQLKEVIELQKKMLSDR
ncbi:uncharacterized protein LOC129790559 [Lutzomyia longipalpis]|nr:uncharacterized protein LOC129790559 [Lutzomyia longipalpis]